MATITLEAEVRTDLGKGASRRLRRLESKVPAVLYGGDKEPQSIHLMHKNVTKALETESIYSSVFDLKVNGKVERVILKDLQRHPYKPIVLHMDLQRVSAKDVLVKLIPLHFLNQDDCVGVKEGGMVNHSMMQVEVRCQAQHLPEYIEIDLLNMNIGDVIHLSNLELPKGVALATSPGDAAHDHPVVSIHLPKLVEEVEDVVEEEGLEATEGDGDAEGVSESAEHKEHHDHDKHEDDKSE